MTLLDEYILSDWAYGECLRGNDIPEIRSLITDSCWAHYYCYDIKDREEMWKK